MCFSFSTRSVTETTANYLQYNQIKGRRIQKVQFSEYSNDSGIYREKNKSKGDGNKDIQVHKCSYHGFKREMRGRDFRLNVD